MNLKYVALLAALPVVAAISVPAHDQMAGEKIPNSYICVFKNDAVSRGNARAEAVRSAQAGQGELKHVYSATIRGFAARAFSASLIPSHTPVPLGTCFNASIASLSE